MFKKLKPKSEFTRKVLTLMTGTTIAQAIHIAISPILTRIYTPKDFGVYALFTAITAIFGSIANGLYELAIMLFKKIKMLYLLHNGISILNILLFIFSIFLILR